MKLESHEHSLTRESTDSLHSEENKIKRQAWVLSHVWHFVTPWAVAHQAPLSMGRSRQEY